MICLEVGNLSERSFLLHHNLESQDDMPAFGSLAWIQLLMERPEKDRK